MLVRMRLRVLFTGEHGGFLFRLLHEMAVCPVLSRHALVRLSPHRFATGDAGDRCFVPGQAGCGFFRLPGRLRPVFSEAEIPVLLRGSAGGKGSVRFASTLSTGIAASDIRSPAPSSASFLSEGTGRGPYTCSRSDSVSSASFLQSGHSRRTSRCAAHRISVPESRYGCTPMSRSRETLPHALFVWIVENTRWPSASCGSPSPPYRRRGSRRA